MSERVMTMSDCSDSMASELDQLYEECEEEEEVMEMSEEELLRMLDSQEPALQVCSRLFHNVQLEQASLTHLSHAQIMQLQSDGYLIVDDCLTAAESQQLHSEALQLHAAGSLEQAAKVGLLPDMALDKLTDVTARGDCITWLHAGTTSKGADSAAGRAVAELEELQHDLQQVMNLEQQSAEYQLAVYAGRGCQYVKHRDALPDDGSDANQRRVTAILYANPGWQEQHGGQLRIWLPPSSSVHHSHSACSQPHTAWQQSPSGPQRSGLKSEQHQAASDNSQRHCTSAAHLTESSLRQQQTASDNCQQQAASDTCQQQAESDNCQQQSVPNGSQSEQSANAESNGNESSGAASSGQAADKQRHDAGDDQEQQLETAGVKNQSQAKGQVRRAFVQQHSGVHFGYTQGEPIVDIDPLPGRLVVFLSGAIDHAVLPSHQARVALTAWCR